MIFDLLFLAVLILTVVICAKKGFVRSLLEVVGFVLAVLIALSISEPMANFVYDNAIEPKVIDKIGTVAIENAKDINGELWESLPEFVTENASFFSIDQNSVGEKVLPFLEKESSSVASVISDSIIKPALVGFISSILSFTLIIVLAILFKLLANLINKPFTFSILGKANTFLGALLGIVQGTAICLVLCVVFDFVFKTVNMKFWLFTEENLLKSFVFSKFMLF